jgi:hypothetical protein
LHGHRQLEWHACDQRHPNDIPDHGRQLDLRADLRELGRLVNGEHGHFDRYGGSRGDDFERWRRSTGSSYGLGTVGALPFASGSQSRSTLKHSIDAHGESRMPGPRAARRSRRAGALFEPCPPCALRYPSTLGNGTPIRAKNLLRGWQRHMNSQLRA